MELIEQIKNKPFKPCLFTIYNNLENEGYIDELSNYLKIKLSIDDFEYITFDLPEKEKNGIIYRVATIVNKYKEFKNYIEKDIQRENPISHCKLSIILDSGIVFLVKLKEYNLIENL